MSSTASMHNNLFPGFKPVNYKDLPWTLMHKEYHTMTNVIVVRVNGDIERDSYLWIPTGLLSTPELAIGHNDPKSGRSYRSYVYDENDYNRRFKGIWVPENEKIFS